MHMLILMLIMLVMFLSVSVFLNNKELFTIIYYYLLIFNTFIIPIHYKILYAIIYIWPLNYQCNDEKILYLFKNSEKLSTYKLFT